ncbi:CocE/NonD family hydrolase [Sphingosinicella sp. BN140058]|uniref:CocE/NonD family hydrolase n=1 Tax=Sphingosinicella sp. BN140058 TaxID=1892855 RepID=UPI001FB0D004|nr:CocE/NonD family hydrolase [Sphingosinicella sp. BN140058]
MPMLLRVAGAALLATLCPLPFLSGAIAQNAVAPGAAFGAYQPSRTYTEQVSSTFYLPMRDGVRLAMTVSRPARGGKAVDGRFPVIWHHSLSATQEPNDGTGPFAGGFRSMPQLTDYGYVVVQVARRGNGQSFGERRGYHDRNEAQDAYDVTQWLAAQPWSDGKVGIYGCSNTGDAALHAVSMRPPALKAAFAGCFSWHKYDAFRRGGIFAQWGTGPARSVEEDMKQQPVDADPDKTLLRQAAEEHQRSTPLFEMWKGMPFRDSFSPIVASRFWAEGSSANYADQIRRSGVALYVVGGWLDELRDQGLIAFMNVPGSRIIIGPWKHCSNDDFPLVEEAHRFFDEHLKGIDTGLRREPPIHYFTQNAGGEGVWRSAANWPSAAGSLQALALGKDGRLGGKAHGERRFEVRYDVACKDAGSGPFAQPCHVPGAGLSYAGDPLAADSEVTGSGVVDLWISADAADANLFAYLEDVAPDGSIRMVTEGRLKASLRALGKAPWTLPAGVPWHRADAEDSEPLVPGKPARLVFELMPASYVFKAGHRLQITITGADYRERAREPSGLARTVRILSDPGHASVVKLPVVTRR